MSEVVVVTGASGALGRVIATALAPSRVVVLVGRDRGALGQTAAAVAAAAGTPLVVQADLRHPDWIERLSAVAPQVDVVVHAAASYAPYTRVEAVTDPEWADVVEVGLGAALRLSRHVIGGMRTRGFGRIVFIGSAVGRLGGHGQAAYATSKAGLVGLARTLALEGGPDGVTSNVVEVGLLDHPRTRTLPAPVWEGMLARSAVGRPGNLQEVAAVVAFLATASAGFVTGAVLPVDGGLGLRLFGPPNGAASNEDPRT